MSTRGRRARTRPRPRPLVVVGDALLDRDFVGRVDRLCPDGPVPVVDDPDERARPGGAGLAALLAARDRADNPDDRDVVLVTALATDPAGRELAALLGRAGVRVCDLGLDGRTPEKVRVRSAGHPLLRLDRGGPPTGRIGPMTAAAREALAEAAAVLVADYGRGLLTRPDVRAALAAAPRRTPVVWDPHPRGGGPVPGATLVTPNGEEAAQLTPEVTGEGLSPTTARARTLAARWSATGVAVTLGERGALLVSGDGPPLVVPAPDVVCLDPCGAGDRFAVTATELLADGALPSEAVAGAVAAATTFVAAGGASALCVGASAARIPSPAAESPEQLARRIRARGGTVVATGGCFDLLHAGHVAVLRQARALGDALIVCLNSDTSVRRLKGPDRPLVGDDDRRAVLEALTCVDGVVVFDSDTPAAALDRLRPQVFAKGGDYALTDIPEAAAVAAWGGQAVVLPYLEGRSTTSILQEATRRAH